MSEAGSGGVTAALTPPLPAVEGGRRLQVLDLAALGLLYEKRLNVTAFKAALLATLDHLEEEHLQKLLINDTEYQWEWVWQYQYYWAWHPIAREWRWTPQLVKTPIFPPLPINITVRATGNCESGFIPQQAPELRAAWAVNFSYELLLASRLSIPAPCFDVGARPGEASNGDVLCSGMPTVEYCDCESDCTDNPSRCGCEDAQACCSAGSSISPPQSPPCEDLAQYGLTGSGCAIPDIDSNVMTDEYCDDWADPECLALWLILLCCLLYCCCIPCCLCCKRRRRKQELLDDDLLNEMAFQDLKDACVSTDSTRRYADRPTG